ncbi:MAG: hypothetical protein ACOVQ7_10050 [Limnoraphis robusta]
MNEPTKVVEPGKSEAWMEDINWEAIASRLPANNRTDVTTGALPARSYWLLRAACGVANESIRGKGKSLMNAQVRRWESSWLKDIKFYADQNGLSFEDAFIQLATNQE